jgi:hypothetical protein
VHARGQRDRRVGQVARVAEDVQRLPADRRQEDLEVAARDELGVHAAGFLEERAPQVRLGHPKRLATPGSHHTGSIATLVTTAEPSSEQHLAVGGEALEGDRLAHFGQVDVRLGSPRCSADVVALRDEIANTSETDAPRGRWRRSCSRRPIAGTARSGRWARCW